MASRGPALGSVQVDVVGNVDRLIADFKAAHTSAERFEKSLQAGVVKSARNAQQATNGLAEAERRVGASFTQASQSANRYVRDINRVGAESARVGRQIEGSTAAIRRSLMASASVLAGAFGVRQIGLLADGYTRFTNQLKVAGIEGDNLTQVQERLFGVAQRYGVQLESLGTLHGRLTQAQKELNATSGQMMQFTTGVAAAIKIQGATSEQSRGALLQLTQALGGTIVRAEEYNSINEGARPILTAVASGIDRFGGSVAKLRAEVIEGKVTSKEFFDGFLKGSADLETQAEKAVLTIGASFQTLNNALGRYIGQTDKAWSATQRIGAGIAALANNLDTIMPILAAIILAFGTKYVMAIGKAGLAMLAKAATDAAAAMAATKLAQTTGLVTVSTRSATIATGAYSGALGGVVIGSNAAAASISRMQVAIATAGTIAGRAGSLLMGAFGGPVGFAIAAIAGSVFLYYRRVAEASAEVEKFNETQKKTHALLDQEFRKIIQAGNAIKGLGNHHRDATGRIKAFAGATGDAAEALHNEATQARRDRIELVALQVVKSRIIAQEARDRLNKAKAQRDQQEQDRLSAPYGAPVPATGANPGKLVAQEEARVKAAEADLRRLESTVDAIIKTPLDSPLYVGANRTQGGRNIDEEIKDKRRQLLIAQSNKNTELQRSLLQEIKLRERILALIKTGLNLENASAQAEAEQIKAPSASGRTIVQFIAPVSGPMSSGYGPRKRPTEGASTFHPAQDFKASVGTPVKAPAGGVIIRTGRNGGLGNVVWIDHGSGTISELNHLSAATKNVGDVVQQGDVVARTGNTGISTGPHLDWRVRTGARAGGKGGRYVNPSKMRFPADSGDAVSNAEEDMAREAEQRADNAERAAEELQRTNDDILQSKQDQLVDEAAIAEMARDRVNAERDRERDQIEAKRLAGDRTDTEAKAQTVANEALRIEELRVIDMNERKRRESESLDKLEATHEFDIAILEAQRDMADTASERREVERQILKAQKAYEKMVLEAIIKSPFTKPFDRKIAEDSLATIDSRYGVKEERSKKDVERDLLDIAPEGSETDQKNKLEELRIDQENRLKILAEARALDLISQQEYEDQSTEIKAEGEAKRRDIENEISSMRIQAAQATAESLAQIARDLGGEQSKAYRALFIVAKAFAIADIVMSLNVAMAKALAAKPFPANIPEIAAVAALGASLISNVMSIAAQFDTGGWTGGQRGKPAGTVHGEEFVVRAGPAGRNRPLLESINSGRDPATAFRNGLGGRALMGGGNMNIVLENHAPGVEHQARQIGPGEVEIIARRVVRQDAPSVVAADIQRPNSRTSKAISRNTTARQARK